MNIQNSFQTPDGQTVIFRRKHPAQSYAGIPGVFALTVEEDFSVRPLTFEAANDLGCLDVPSITMHPLFSAYQSLGKIGVCVCALPRTSETYRRQLANDLNAGVFTPAAA